MGGGAVRTNCLWVCKTSRAKRTGRKKERENKQMVRGKVKQRRRRAENVMIKRDDRTGSLFITYTRISDESKIEISCRDVKALTVA